MTLELVIKRKINNKERQIVPFVVFLFVRSFPCKAEISKLGKGQSYNGLYFINLELEPNGKFGQFSLEILSNLTSIKKKYRQDNDYCCLIYQ